MPSVTEEKIDAFIADLHADDAFDPNSPFPPDLSMPTQTFDGEPLTGTAPTPTEASPDPHRPAARDGRVRGRPVAVFG